jgi:hypothetical protein
MTRNDDFIGQLEVYLDEYEGSTPLPNEVRDAIRAELPKIKQVGRLPGLMRFLTMTMHVPAVRYGLVAAVMVAAAVLGASILSRGTGGPPDPPPSPLATPGALPTAASLEPGSYVVANPYIDEDPLRSCEQGCSDYLSITFTVPDGWASADGLVFKHLDEPNEVAFSIWTPGDIYLDPCRWQTSEVGPDTSAHTDNANGEVVLDDLYPLLNQVGRSASAPTNVTLGGERALRIEQSVSADLDISTCDQGEFRSWTEWDVPGSANSHHAAGQVDVVYFVDVDRRPLFIDASHMPGASVADLAELDAILDSMFIDRGF